MGIEGRLQVDLALAGAQVAKVRISLNRPVHAASVLRGRSIADVQKMLPMLFTVCSAAQSCAAARALEQAGGLVIAPATDRLRQSLVDLETLREHLWRVLLDWPGSVGEAPARQVMAEVMGLQRQFTGALCLGADVFAFGGPECDGDRELMSAVRARLLELLSREVFGAPVGTWLQVKSYSEFDDWVGRRDTPATRLMHKLMLEGWESAGACTSLALPSLGDSEVEQAMRDYHYVERPQWLGECRETTSLGRVNSALLQDLRKRFGNGLLTRVVARLHEMAALALNLVPADGQGRSMAAEASGLGIGQVAAARGQLVHRVELDRHQRVADYRILAPTEWNFHPAGVVSCALSALRGGAEQIEQQGRLLISAIDPCVGYDLRLNQGG